MDYCVSCDLLMFDKSWCVKMCCVFLVSLTKNWIHYRTNPWPTICQTLYICIFKKWFAIYTSPNFLVKKQVALDYLLLSWGITMQLEYLHNLFVFSILVPDWKVHAQLTGESEWLHVSILIVSLKVSYDACKMIESLNCRSTNDKMDQQNSNITTSTLLGEKC